MAGPDAYELCRRLTAHHGKTYYFSTLFFPPSIRRSVFALYGFVRCPDEIVDNPAPGSDPAQGLAEFRAATMDALKCGSSDHPVLDAFAETAHAHRIPPEYPMAFLDAMEMDLTRDRYETLADLRTYTYGSASVVGLMMCHLIGATSPEALGPAHDLGFAMQLTNFLRDIGEDWRERRRIYLPLEDMRRFGYSERDLANGVVNDSFRALMRYEISVARQYYACADDGMAFIPLEGRLPVRLARVLYSRILNKIEESNYDVFTKRAATTKLEKFAVALCEQWRHIRECRDARRLGRFGIRPKHEETNNIPV